MGAENNLSFRAEALRYRADRLHGDISLATPLRWQGIGFLLLAALVASIVFLSSAAYTRVEIAPGTVTLDKGVATIVPSRAGIVTGVEVVEGQAVRAGQPLARIRSEEDMAGGATVPARIRRSLEEQRVQLAAQATMLMAAARAEQDRLRAQEAGLTGEIASIARQIEDQHRLIDVATRDYANAERVAANGFISRHDLDLRRTTLLARQQQGAQLEQARIAKSAAVAEARRSIAQADAAARSQVAGARSQRAALAQQFAEADLAGGYTLAAPIDGVVTAVTARSGQATDRQQPLMIVMPEGAAPRVELFVPTSAAGFLRPGQEVRIAIDAFPYQQFGTVQARVAHVSATTVARPRQDGIVPVYLVTADLRRPWIMAFGRRQPLVPGMTLSARIVTQRRSLMAWLFEPLLAVANR